MADRSENPPAWAAYARWLIGSAGGLLAAAILFVLLVGPYGPTPFSLPIDRPAVMRAQRYAFPALVRSGRYDGFIIGTSTARPLDPQVLARAFGGQIANVSMFGSTPYEQRLTAELIAREVRPLNSFVWGLDTVWCASTASEALHKRQPMPTWLYDGDPWNDIGYLINLSALETSFSRVMYLLGLKKLRVRTDGFLIETPPESTYDLAKARKFIWEMTKPPHDVAGRVEPGALARSPELKYPALKWVESILAALPADTRRVLVLQPVHIAYMPARGSNAERRINGCKAELIEIARRQNAVAVDFLFRSALTEKDENFWDYLHHRRHLAPQVMDAIIAGATDGRPTDISVVLHPPKEVAQRR